MVVVEVSCCAFKAGKGLIAGVCGGAVVSGGAALQPSGSARRAEWERTKEDPSPLPAVLSSGPLYAPVDGAVIGGCADG